MLTIKRTRFFFFHLIERIRRVIHFRLTGFSRSASSKKDNKNLTEYYKLYDEIYTISDSPEFVNMYKNRHLIRDDFLQHRKNNIIPASGTLLDLGCGEGGNAIYFHSLGYSATGVDASENAIRLAKKNAVEEGSGALFEVTDILNMNTDGKNYNICTDVGCLHMLVLSSHRKDYFNTVRNLMTKDSVFYLFQSATEKDVVIDNEEEYVANSVSFEHRRILDNGKVVRHSGCGGMPVSLAQYCTELENAGFEIVNRKTVDTPVGLFASIVAKIK
ncbi:hypothetical protein MNBD_GAMMA23-1537 [hydrothermal vent metagenome]|uniref:Methyltransferase domain-containing protein n=1 Tax=hydrothermal vent metagenome TaxID=652676 RepID=A0A3B1AEZ9_9ZZZZ